MGTICKNRLRGIYFILVQLFVYNLQAQQVTKISPNSGSLAGQTKVNIYGSGFTGNTSLSVQFGAVGMLPDQVTIVNDTLITVINNAVNKAQSVKVDVIIDGKIYNPPTKFNFELPVINTFIPDSSSTAGGKLITIKGKYFSGASYVKFGAAGNTPLTVNDSIITVKNPPHVSGNVSVEVQIQGDSVTAPLQFKYKDKSIVNTYQLSLENLTGLSANYKVYVLGYSTASQKYLTVDPSTKTGSFTKYTNATGYINSYELGTDITSITLSNKNAINGSRIYFFIADTTKKYQDNSGKTSNGNLGFKYEKSGSSVTQVTNPPQTAFPQYNYIEATFLENQALFIDVSTVDGFFFPLSILAEDTSGNELDRIGQNSGISAKDITSAYKPFMQKLQASSAYNDLYYKAKGNLPVLLNPGTFLENNTNGLDTIFNTAMNSLFTDASLNMNIWQNGTSTFAKNYTVTPVNTLTFPGTANTHTALAFTSTGATTLHVFNPVGFSVVSYEDSSTKMMLPILGKIKNNVLTFKTPLPLDCGLVKGMYVSSGGGSTDGITQITDITISNKTIIAVTLNSSSNYNSFFQYKFAKAPKNYYYSPGHMTFAGIGLFADGAFRYTDANDQVVVNGIENQLSTALNRGVALLQSTDTTSAGRTTKNWGDETKWYPAGTSQNLFSYFMHTAIVNGKHIFSLPKNAVKSSRGVFMAKAYGFAYDENPIGGTQKGQPEVPSEFPGSYPKNTTQLKLTLGPWN